MPNTNPFLKIFTVSFFGHRFTDNSKEIEDRLEKLIINLQYRQETKIWWVDPILLSSMSLTTPAVLIKHLGMH